LGTLFNLKSEIRNPKLSDEARVGFYVEGKVVLQGVGVAVIGGGGDHGGIVGAEDERGIAERDAEALAQSLAEEGVGSDAARDEHFARSELRCGGRGLLYEGVYDRGLERCREVGYGEGIGVRDTGVGFGRSGSGFG
jgi:hypothetical protein